MAPKNDAASEQTLRFGLRDLNDPDLHFELTARFAASILSTTMGEVDKDQAVQIVKGARATTDALIADELARRLAAEEV